MAGKAPTQSGRQTDGPGSLWDVKGRDNYVGRVYKDPYGQRTGVVVFYNKLDLARHWQASVTVAWRSDSNGAASSSAASTGYDFASPEVISWATASKCIADEFDLDAPFVPEDIKALQRNKWFMPKNPPWESKPGAGAAGGSKGKTTGGRAAVAAEPAGPSAATPAAAAGAVGSETDNGEVSEAANAMMALRHGSPDRKRTTGLKQATSERQAKARSGAPAAGSSEGTATAKTASGAAPSKRKLEQGKTRSAAAAAAAAEESESEEEAEPAAKKPRGRPSKADSAAKGTGGKAAVAGKARGKVGRPKKDAGRRWVESEDEEPAPEASESSEQATTSDVDEEGGYGSDYVTAAESGRRYPRALTLRKGDLTVKQYKGVRKYMEGDFAVDRILDEDILGGEIFYLVKWLGFEVDLVDGWQAAETLYDEKGEPLKVLQRWNKNKPQYYFDNLAREEEEKKGKGKEKGQRRS